MEDLKYWIWLSRIEGVTPKEILEILEKFKEPKEIYNKTKEELILFGIREKIAKEITKSEYKQNLDKYIEYMQRNNIKTITIREKSYPESLKKIYDPPILLYIKGNKKILNEKGIAIVGSRICTSYGKFVAKKISYNLSINNINVISGLALGIDSCAHLGSLAGNRQNCCSFRVRIR